MYKAIEKCRVCGGKELTEVLDLGVQALTGVFPSDKSHSITAGPLKLVKCASGGDSCGLLQLQHTYDLSEMYGLNYGYRSGLNMSMVAHLRRKVEEILRLVSLERGDLVIDIGSNDSTTLQAYPLDRAMLVGVDPTGIKFKEYYPDHIRLIPDFFSADKIREEFGSRKAKVITSFSMFYDLEDPLGFMRDVAQVMDDEGLWIFEQSYMPMMLQRNSYDTVCHEHLEYYALEQIKWMADRAGLRIIDVDLNDVNGGSFSVTAAKHDSGYSVSSRVDEMLRAESSLELDTLKPYRAFAQRVINCREQLREFLDVAKRAGKKVCALGASTKGNVILQYCRTTQDDIQKIGEVNADKFNCYTPGTLIPIVPEGEVLAERPDYLIVLPWHFREFFEINSAFRGQTLVYPLPTLSTNVR